MLDPDEEKVNVFCECDKSPISVMLGHLIVCLVVALGLKFDRSTCFLDFEFTLPLFFQSYI